MSPQTQGEVVDAVNVLNAQANATLDDPEISVRIRQYEIAFRMQMLHLLGIDHKQLTFRFQGRDFRLTHVPGQVARRIIA